MQIEVRILNNNLVTIIIKIAKTFAKSFFLIEVFCKQIVLIGL